MEIIHLTKIDLFLKQIYLLKEAGFNKLERFMLSSTLTIDYFNRLLFFIDSFSISFQFKNERIVFNFIHLLKTL